ncbi:bifunctional epoxide hydrolase 2 [Xyrichtys novacula]|uniref:Bifunctional epoxide hydrolase 2 n=2 Tax=Xyrichtys novacula TaxID=13765 RepID=A0AAV1HLR9_XYRNO|nr:bifunctional epoxide hydrolase 2 [Xyrichtys novacula]
MAQKKAILFNFWGVTVSTQHAVFNKLEGLHNLPGGFLSSVVAPKDSAMSRAERGELTLTQMVPALEAECAKEAQDRSLTLPSDWSVKVLLEELREAMMDVRAVVLQTAARLRQNGLLTAVLANHWVDDSSAGDHPACLLSQLGRHFDLVLQSCRAGHRVPETEVFTSALQHLGVTSEQALWLDAEEEGVKAARAAGMEAILVENLDDALNNLSEFTGVQTVRAACPPPSCSPEEVAHGYVTIRPGVRTHFVEMGSGPPVLLCHGFPESWYSWRYQIPALAAAGFRVLALDMKGYGESTAPPDWTSPEDHYSPMFIFSVPGQSMPQVTLVGHDWGGIVVWNMAQFFPERVRAAASLNTPLFRADPASEAKLKSIPIFDYQIYFQTPGAAEAELEKDLERSFKIFFSSSAEEAQRPSISTAGVCARGGLFVGLPEQIPRSSMLTEADLKFYVSQYKEKGFRRPLNWYRNNEANQKWMCSRPATKPLMPTLMVTAGKDPVLLPAFTKGMEEVFPNLSRGHIEECGHWTQMDRPAETNNILIKWLKEAHKKPGCVSAAPKL